MVVITACIIHILRRDDHRASPRLGTLPEAEEIDRLRRDLIRALESGYAPDYQELIKRYFDLLQQRDSGS